MCFAGNEERENKFNYRTANNQNGTRIEIRIWQKNPFEKHEFRRLCVKFNPSDAKMFVSSINACSHLWLFSRSKWCLCKCARECDSERLSDALIVIMFKSIGDHCMLMHIYGTPINGDRALVREHFVLLLLTHTLAAIWMSTNERHLIRYNCNALKSARLRACQFECSHNCWLLHETIH